MAFLYPAFLLGALAIAVPIVLHLLRRDVAPEVPFTAVHLLRRSPVERSHRRRLRDLLLLLARVAALLLLAFAFARPYLSGAAASAPLRIVAVDRSYSLGGEDRFARALELARAAIDEAGAGEPVAVIAFDERAEVVAEPGSAADARAALAALQPGFGATRYGAVIARALETAQGAAAQLIVVTDLQRAGWENEEPARIPPSLSVEVRDAGELPGNAAIVSVEREEDHLAATIVNARDTALTSTLRVLRDGKEVAAVPFTADPAARVKVDVPYRAPADGSVSLTIEDPGGLPADDARYLLLEPGVRPRVLIVTSGAPNSQSGFYLARALATTAGENGGVETDVLSGADLSALARQELPAEVAVVVLLSTRGIDRGGREAVGEFVRNGGGLMMAAGSEMDGAVLSAILGWDEPVAASEREVDAISLAPADPRHPIFRPFGPLAANLGHVRFNRVWRLPVEGWTTLALFTDGTPALLERREGAGRVLLFASDFDRRWNDFPLHPSFVPFAIEAARYVSGDRRVVREFVVGEAPPGVERAPGVFRGPGQKLVAVNVDTRESSAGRLTPGEFDAMLRRTEPAVAPSPAQQAAEIESRQNYWRYGLLLMLAALVAESFVGRPS